MDGIEVFSFFWRIENYSYCLHRRGRGLVSPNFTTLVPNGGSWNLKLCPKGKEGVVALFLRRTEDDGPETVPVLCHLSVLLADGSSFPSTASKQAFARGKEYRVPKFLTMDDVLVKRRADFLPQDTLTLRCRIFERAADGVPKVGLSSARTRIKVEKISFCHTTEEFSTRAPKKEITMKIPFHSNDERFLSCSLHFTGGSCCQEKMVVEIVPSDPNRSLRTCELYLLDRFGNEVKCGGADARSDPEGGSVRSLPLSLTRKVIMIRKQDYLPDDKLTLLVECTFSSGLEFQTIEETRRVIPRAAAAYAKYLMPSLNNESSAELTAAQPGALEDIKALYVNDSFTDVELKTKTKSFKVHRVVLCARSPVFSAMMSSDMRERNTDCIEVDDLEDDVVEQLLLFLYSDTLKKLEWTTATRLYYAADKYQVSKLRKECFSFLVANLDSNNAGDLLLLADTHGDAQLKKLVEDFILQNEEGVFGSAGWEKLMEANPVLAMKAMHRKYKKRKLE